MEEWINDIHCGDCLDVISNFDDNSIDLVVTSPPYNVGVDYGKYNDSISQEEYKSMMSSLFELLDSKLKDVGRVCVNISLKNDGGIVDMPKVIKTLSQDLNWTQRFEIIWDKGSSESSSAWGSWRSPSSPRPIFNHEYILIFDVGKEKKKSEKTIPKEKFMKYVKSVWNLSPETSSSHPAPFPEEIPKRLIQLNSYENDVVLDPFIGSGTTAVVAEKLDRNWIGIDLDEEYVDMSLKRIESETKQIFADEGIFEY